MCAARLGISIHEINDLTPVELNELMKENSQCRYDDFKRQAELGRMFTMVLWNTQVKTESQQSDPRRFIRFEWEDDIDDDVAEDLLNTDWEALDRKYSNLVRQSKLN